jgi:hypothetical protein
MDGLLVAWSEEEIQAIDNDNFHDVVVNVVESFFDDVPDPTSVTVVWKTETRQHKVRYEVIDDPQLGMESCYVEIVGGKDGEYRIELDPDELSIRQHSNDWVEELTYLEFRAPGVTVDKTSNKLSLPNIPEKLKKKAIRAKPEIEWG